MIYLKKLGILISGMAILLLASCTEDRLTIELPSVTFDSLTLTDPTSIHVFVMSDWGYSGSPNQLSVEQAMNLTAKRIRLDFILTCGDNFQFVGVPSSTDSLWFYNFENVYRDSALQVSWYPALGNHDYYGNPDAEVEYSTKNSLWHMPARYYTFAKPISGGVAARFIVMDTQGLITAYQQLSEGKTADSIPQLAWLKDILEHRSEKWTIVTGHHTLFSASPHHGDTEELKILLKPLFEKYNIDFYICGHDHNFEHAREKGTYPDYIVTGTCGTPRLTASNERTIYSISTLGFTYLALSRDSIQLNFLNSEGKVGYHFAKRKPIF